MHCARCQQENPPQAKFCLECAAPGTDAPGVGPPAARGQVLPRVRRELIAVPVDVLVADAQVGLEATTTIPIVSATMGDPVKAGLVASLARPGGNLTGVSAQTFDIWPKQLELAGELVPGLKRLCFLFDVTVEPDAVVHAAEFGALARAIGVTVRPLPLGSADDLRTALRTVQQEAPQTLFIWSSPLIAQHRRDDHGRCRPPIAGAERRPTSGGGRRVTDPFGGLAGSVPAQCLVRRPDPQGPRPGELPIEQPTRFHLVLNLGTAKALRIAIPESIRLRADEVIR
jgi:putative ABC transport system substrate-binding protein